MTKIVLFEDVDVTVTVPKKYEGKEVHVEEIEIGREEAKELISKGMKRPVINYWVYYEDDDGKKHPVPDFEQVPMTLKVGYKRGETPALLLYQEKETGELIKFTAKEHKFTKYKEEHTKAGKKYLGYGVAKIKAKWADPVVGWGPGGRG